MGCRGESVSFTQHYSDGEEVQWFARLAVDGEGMALRDGHWSGAGQQGGSFEAERVGGRDEAALSDAALQELRCRALALGAPASGVALAMRGSAPEPQLQALITATAAGLPCAESRRVAELRVALEGESLKELSTRAENLAAFGAVEGALEAPKPKASLIDLLLEIAAAPMPVEASGLPLSSAQGANWGRGARLWCPEQLDPWWSRALPLAAPERIWFRKPDGGWIQLGVAEHAAVLRTLCVRLGSGADELVSEAWQVDPGGEPLAENPEEEAERYAALAAAGTCWT